MVEEEVDASRAVEGLPAMDVLPVDVEGLCHLQ
jgi:hypothetical protein